MNQNKKRNKRQIGSEYEEIAARYLAENGLMIIERNYRLKTGEIDIIALDQDTLVFVEVKYRKSRWAGGALAAVSRAKQKVICRTAFLYLLTQGWDPGSSCRFDVVGIDGDTLTWVRSAFDYPYSCPVF